MSTSIADGDDLLDGEGDLIDDDFELDGADEDALLADDFEEVQAGNKMKRQNSSRDSSRKDHNNEDEDIIELGVADEELSLTEEDKSDAASKANGEIMISPIVFNDKSTVDSDDEEREKDRGRFKTEREITIPRARTTIPETLEGVVIKKPATVISGPGRGGGGRGRGNNRGMRGGNQHHHQGPPRFMMGPPGHMMHPHHPLHQRPQRLPPPPHHHHHHHHHGGGMMRPPMPPPPHYHHHPHHNQAQQQQVGAQQGGGAPPMMGGGMMYHHHGMGGGGGPIRPPQQQQHLVQPPIQQPPPPQQPTQQQQQPKILVNPHFKPRAQANSAGGGGTSWQGPPQQSNFPPQLQQYSQPQYNNYSSGVQQKPQWNEQMGNSNFYQDPQQPQYQNQNFQDNFYNGVPQPQPPEQTYYQPQPSQNMPPTYQMNWDQSNYYPQPEQQQQMPQPMEVYGPPQNQVPMEQMPPQFGRPPNQMRPQQGFKRQINNFQGKRGGGPLGMRSRRGMDGMMQPPPGSSQMMTRRKGGKKKENEGRKVVRNLHQVVTVDNPIPPQMQETPSTMEVEVREEDEEMKEYRLKIEEQKKLREQVLRMKEEKRAEAIQQRQQLAGTKVTKQPDVPLPGQAKPNKIQEELKAVRVRTKDGRTVLRRLPLSVIQKLRKVLPENETQAKPQGETALGMSRIVQVDNLSATTNKSQILGMAKQVGAVQSLELEREKGRATLKFEEASSATAFLGKFQRKMVDLSMITITLLQEN